MLGEFLSKMPVLVGAQQRIVDQTTDARGIGIGGEARIEVEWLALDAGDEIARRIIRCGKNTATGIESREQDTDDGETNVGFGQ
jgi:hypothetical protein